MIMFPGGVGRGGRGALSWFKSAALSTSSSSSPSSCVVSVVLADTCVLGSRGPSILLPRTPDKLVKTQTLFWTTPDRAWDLVHAEFRARWQELGVNQQCEAEVWVAPSKACTWHRRHMDSHQPLVMVKNVERERPLPTNPLPSDSSMVAFIVPQPKHMVTIWTHDGTGHVLRIGSTIPDTDLGIMDGVQAAWSCSDFLHAELQ